MVSALRQFENEEEREQEQEEEQQAGEGGRRRKEGRANRAIRSRTKYN